MITNIIVYINSRNIIKAKQMAMISTTNLRRQDDMGRNWMVRLQALRQGIGCSLLAVPVGGDREDVKYSNVS